MPTHLHWKFLWEDSIFSKTLDREFNGLLGMLEALKEEFPEGLQMNEWESHSHAILRQHEFMRFLGANEAFFA
jgi:hypothetical protein